MGTSYSVDLRQRIVAAYERGEGSFESLAQRFSVSSKTARNYLKLIESTGSLEPLPHTGGSGRKKLFDHHYKDIEAWLDKDKNLFWWQVADKIKDKYDLSIDPSQLSRQMKARGFTRKKTRGSPQK